MTTMGMFRKNFPLTPGTKSIGAKNTQVVTIAKQTGTKTSCAPSMAAWSRGMPWVRFWWIDSPTTMASSTTMPSVTMNAKRLIMLIDTSAVGRKSIEPAKLIGMPKVTQKASRGARKSPSTKSTSTRPIRALRSSRSMRSA